jgi:hypothetical protein
MRPVLDLLTRAQDLIRDPAHWHQGWFAVDADGRECPSDSKQAVCFCSIGAMARAKPETHQLTQLARKYLQEAIGLEQSIVDFNDTHTHDQVMAMWDRARELARAAA